MDNPGTEFSREVIITNELGLHAACAAKIAKLAQNAKSKVWLTNGEEKVDASDILDILTLACEKGSKITLKIDDRSDLFILNDIVRLIERGFGE